MDRISYFQLVIYFNKYLIVKNNFQLIWQMTLVQLTAYDSAIDKKNIGKF